MIRILISFLLVGCLSFLTSAQNGSDSPYSRYGIGDISARAFGQNNAMGGLSLGLRSPYHLNPVNFAANSAIDTLSFRFELGMHARSTTFSNAYSSETAASSNYSYLAFGFPILKGWGVSFGLIPYSNVGYGIRKDSMYTTPWGTNQLVANTFTGEGGIDQVFFGTGFEVGKHLSIGMNLSYLFGSLNQERQVFFTDTAGIQDAVTFTTLTTDRIVVSDFLPGLQAQVYGNFRKGTTWCLGFFAEPGSRINAYKSLLTLVENNYSRDTIEYVNDKNDYLKLPLNLGLGFTLKNEQWIFGADYFLQDWEKATFLGKADSLSNSWRFSTGIQFIPAERSVTSYFNRIRYRVGFNQNLTYLNLNGQHLTDQSFSIGLGLPLWRSKSSLNLSYTMGRRGTTDQNLIMEKYHVFSLNLSLHDIWFVKRKFD